jgi:peptidyl-prolyl cis-trans isomerase SurA
MRYSVTSRIQRDSRSTKSVESLVEKLKKEYRFSDKGKNAAFNLLLKKLNKEDVMPPATDLLTLPGIGKLKPMATFADQTITIQDFIHYLDRFQGMDLNKQAKMFLDVQYEDFIKDFMLRYERSVLEVKYPEYKELINEYHHGMILFEMNNEKVWNESLKDSTALEVFYEKIKFHYLDKEGNPKPLAEIRSAVLTEYQNELENEWLMELRKRYPVWINEELFKSILKNK